MSAPPQGQGADAEKNIEIWKVKKLIKRLEAARGNGTSMISLIIRTHCAARLGGITAYTMCSSQGPGLSRRQDVG
jgi:hypothetical protein